MEDRACDRRGNEMNDKKEIILCLDCDGYGKNKSVSKYSDGETRLDNSLCKPCEGSGRLLKVVSYQLYDGEVDEATKLLCGTDETKDEDEHVWANTKMMKVAKNIYQDDYCNMIRKPKQQNLNCD